MAFSAHAGTVDYRAYHARVFSFVCAFRVGQDESSCRFSPALPGTPHVRSVSFGVFLCFALRSPSGLLGAFSLFRLAFHETSRFVKRLYVPLPDKPGRRQLMNILLKTSPSSLTPADIEEVVEKTEGRRSVWS